MVNKYLVVGLFCTKIVAQHLKMTVNYINAKFNASIWTKRRSIEWRITCALRGDCSRSPIIQAVITVILFKHHCIFFRGGGLWYIVLHKIQSIRYALLRWEVTSE